MLGGWGQGVGLIARIVVLIPNGVVVLGGTFIGKRLLTDSEYIYFLFIFPQHRWENISFYLSPGTIK